MTVATTWEVSLLRVEEVSPEAVDLLRLCAFSPRTTSRISSSSTGPRRFQSGWPAGWPIPWG